MNILDDHEEYSKLISNVGINAKKDDLENKVTALKEKVDLHESNLNSLKDNVDSRLSQICIDLKLQKQETDQNNSSCKTNNDSLLKDLTELKDYRQTMEDYKKVTNDRIEKLVKLFLSINK